jgi:small GTP-binding protein
MREWTPKTGYKEALRRIEECREKGGNSTFLDLDDISLRSLPPEIGQLSALTLLDLSNNQLTCLPPEIGKLSALTVLDISDNQLTCLPREIGQLSLLTLLDLSNNQLASLPPEIGQLSALTQLKLSDNPLTSLPPEIGQLSALTQLILSDNRLTSLPTEIGQLSALTHLDLSNNQLTSLPSGLRKLEKLIPLFLHGNPGLGLKDEALGLGRYEVFRNKKASPKPSQEILAIYFAQQASGTSALNEVKIILVGRGGGGKTSIRKRLIEDRFDPNQVETAGIEIDHWELGRKHDGITAHVWDFAGQDITHATHQFFLTRRSLYLLVLEGRSDLQDRDAEYWLRLIRAFGADSPVILVLNKWDEKPFGVADFTLRQEFPYIRAFIRTDCRSGLGLQELKQTLGETAAAMKTVKQPFPTLWFSVKEEMAGMKENYLPLCRYREICQKHGVAAADDQNALAGYLHDLGIILHYAEDERLSDTTC